MRMLIAAAVLASFAASAEEPLRAGLVPNSPPFVMGGPKDKPEGFTVMLFEAVAAQMHRPIIFTEAPFPELTRDLADKKVDVLAGPIRATPDRATELLFTEGYLWSEYQFGVRAGTNLASLNDLRGRRLAVHEGSDYAEWAERNAAKIGFSIVPERDNAGVFNAVRNGQADASLTGSAALSGAIARRDGLAAGLSLPETRTHESASVAPGQEELRDEIEDALRCLKQNGTIARLAVQWLGRDPGPEDLERLIVPGYGVPGLAGYDAKLRKSHCSA